ncbi:MerR HTH family regulatory protein [Gemmobacter megaterium]|uniref:MerR HTH family regulatory protein n=1 Tax=Gemmobacter megaterium TaxID=1086013 RepID=A0A1N7L0E2_9RHOB|nr:MerR family transcriptional regulator [Gemmobacter megaterium]GGE04791.1 hypothetical protein GCM10011345_07840 [Gemmobacter megaterium]SIS67120.1 MerR HTH family regulatory protein [Gemmobacter megaterium]
MTEQSTFSLQEAADIAGVERDTLRQWLSRGHLQVERGSGQKRWTWAEVFYAATFAELAKGTKDYELLGSVSSQTFARFHNIARLAGNAEADGICLAYRAPETGQLQVEVFADLTLALRFAQEVLGGIAHDESPAELRIFNLKQIERAFLDRMNAVLARRKEAKT